MKRVFINYVEDGSDAYNWVAEMPQIPREGEYISFLYGDGYITAKVASVEYLFDAQDAYLQASVTISRTTTQ